MKKPIQVSPRADSEDGEASYDLVYGQGRLEACTLLGHKEIPALVIELSKQDRLLRSLVENMARRAASPLALINEIERLKTEGYSNVEIGKKLDMSDGVVGGYLALKNSGEERLLDAALSGRIPLGVAIDIAKTDGAETQRELLKAYDNKQLNQLSIRTVKRLIDQRRFVGKQRDTGRGLRRHLTSTESLVNAYKRESQRQRLLVKKAKICEARLVFIVTAFNKLLDDENFTTLLKAEGLFTMPKYLWSKVKDHAQKSLRRVKEAA